mgnify:CR=1 FL=1
MKVGNIVKWNTDTAHFALVSGIVIDTYMSDGQQCATVFWFGTQERQNIITTRLTTISRA